MSDAPLVFRQVVDLLHREQFDRCVELHPMPRTSRGFSARDQFLSMVFAQLTYREGLRDIEVCLRIIADTHQSFRVSRSWRRGRDRGRENGNMKQGIGGQPLAAASFVSLVTALDIIS